MNYTTLSNFGNFGTRSGIDESLSNPLTYCAVDSTESRRLHGGESVTMDRNSRQCQLFMAEYCAQRWDGFCQVASESTDMGIPNQGSTYNQYNYPLTTGDILIKNTASVKYLSKMRDGQKKWEPFDPTNANSPMISYWTSNSVPEYTVNPRGLDADPVMNQLLSRVYIAPDVLKNIYNTMRREGTLSTLKGTKLGKFYLDQGLKL